MVPSGGGKENDVLALNGLLWKCSNSARCEHLLPCEADTLSSTINFHYNFNKVSARASFTLPFDVKRKTF